VEEHGWEAGAVFNCAAISHNGLVHLVYRATDITSNGSQGDYINSLGYAVSSDGISFSRLDRPILCNDVQQELRGPEDPRIVEIGGTFYMTYTGYGGRFPGDYRISLASSPNLISWQRHGVLLDEPNKDAALLPDIWLAFSDDLLHWDDHRSIMGPLPNSEWESNKVGAAGPPLRTEDGWLLMYHGVGGLGDSRRYSLGVALLDLQDPTRVIARQAEPILEPELRWEIDGYVPNVVFSCGQAIVGKDIYVYYGGADTVIGVAAMGLQDVTFG